MCSSGSEVKTKNHKTHKPLWPLKSRTKPNFPRNTAHYVALSRQLKSVSKSLHMICCCGYSRHKTWSCSVICLQLGTRYRTPVRNSTEIRIFFIIHHLLGFCLPPLGHTFCFSIDIFITEEF